jgi:hypothetical protein
MTIKKFFLHLYTYLAAPALIAGHWYTQHPAFLYLFGLSAVITLVMMLVGIAGMVILFVQEDFTTVLPPLPGWKLAIGWVYQLTSITYLLYVQAFSVATIYIMALIAMNVMIVGMKAYNKKQTEQLTSKW